MIITDSSDNILNESIKELNTSKLESKIINTIIDWLKEHDERLTRHEDDIKKLSEEIERE